MRRNSSVFSAAADPPKVPLARRRGQSQSPGRGAAERPAAAHRVADAIGERADAGAGHVDLDRVDAAPVVGHDAEIPGFAIEIDGPAVDAVLRERERVQRSTNLQHVRLEVEAHDVETEAVDLVPFAHSTTEWTMSFSIIACSVAVSAQQLSLSTTPSPFSRW